MQPTSATIKLFLPHGDARRLRIGEISNWSGKALAYIGEAEMVRERMRA